MGSGSFSTTRSADRATVRSTNGVDAFVHHAAVKAGRADALHPTLDLTKKPRR